MISRRESRSGVWEGGRQKSAKLPEFVYLHEAALRSVPASLLLGGKRQPYAASAVVQLHCIIE